MPSTSIEAAVTDHLTDDSGLTALIGSNFFPGCLPQRTAGTSRIPAVVFSVVANQHVRTLGGPTGVARIRLRFDCFAVTQATSTAIAEAIRAALDGVSGNFDGYRVTSCVLEDEATYTRAPNDGSDDWQYDKQVEYLIRYRYEV